jgi:hypothetical protein
MPITVMATNAFNIMLVKLFEMEQVIDRYLILPATS